jgi:predicted aspartyl protease
MRSTRLRFLLWPLLSVLSACASLPPERAAEEELMWEAARECKARYSTISSIDRIDSFGRLHFTSMGGPDNGAFIECYSALVGRKLAAAKLTSSGTVTPATLAAGKTSVTVTMAGTSAFAPVTVNEAQTGTLLVDTGATNTILTPAFAQRLGITVPLNARRRIMTVAGGSTITVPFVRVQSVRVGQFSVETLDVGVYDILPHVNAAQGILGTDFLRHFRTVVDPAARTLALAVKDSPPGPTPTPVSAPAPTTPELRSLAAPVWTVGDEWTYRWESPRGSGTFVWRVEGQQTVDDVAYYVVASGSRRTYYRTADLALAFDKLDGKVETKLQPPVTYFRWPLSAGLTWQEAYVSERPLDRQTSNVAQRSMVEGEEVVTVPAGNFRALRIVRRYLASNTVSFEGWYSPDVKFWVRQRNHFSYGVRVRELTAYRHAEP